MEYFLDFYNHSVALCRYMLVNFSNIATFMFAEFEPLSQFFDAPMSIAFLLVGGGFSVYITRAIIRFFAF